MFDLRSSEEELRRALRLLEPRTPYAEILSQALTGASARINVAGTSVERAPRLAGAAIRAWAGDHWAEVASGELSAHALAEAAHTLNRTLSKRSGGPAPGIVVADSRREEVHPGPRPMGELGPDGLVSRARRYREWALDVSGVTDAEAFITVSDDARLYLNTAGAFEYQVVPRVGASVTAIAVENGRAEHDWVRLGGVGGEEILDPVTESRVRAAAEGAKALLRAKSPPVGPMTVVLDPTTAGTLAHESFGHGTEADQFLRGRSYLQPLRGATVGPEMLSIVDDGTFPGGWGSMYFDDEGIPTRPNHLVERGRFVGILHDRTTAAALGAVPTGNARRADFLSRLWVRMTNTYVVPGDLAKEEILAEADHGVLLEQPTSGMEDPLGGRMQIKVLRGYRIEHGELTELYSSMALSGRVLEVLRAVRGVGRVDRLVMDGLGYCGKGYGDYVPAGAGGPYLLTEAIVGPA